MVGPLHAFGKGLDGTAFSAHTSRCVLGMASLPTRLSDNPLCRSPASGQPRFCVIRCNRRCDGASAVTWPCMNSLPLTVYLGFVVICIIEVVKVPPSPPDWAIILAYAWVLLLLVNPVVSDFVFPSENYARAIPERGRWTTQLVLRDRLLFCFCILLNTFGASLMAWSHL